MPRVRGNRRAPAARPGSSAREFAAEDIVAENLPAFFHYIASLPLQASVTDRGASARPAKRARTAGTWNSICVAREHLETTYRTAIPSQLGTHILREDVGEYLTFKVRRPRDTTPSVLRLNISPRTKPRGQPFSVSLPLDDDDNLTPTLRTALRVLETQSFDPGEGGCIFASVGFSIRQLDSIVELDLVIEVKWSEKVGIWGGNRANSNFQRTLRDEVLSTWHPDLGLRLADGTQVSWSPQDFYEAACVPDQGAMGVEVENMEIPKLEAKLYPFQRRAVQWLLQREGVQWRRGSQGEGAGVHPYISPASHEIPISFATAKDAEGKAFHVSHLLGTVARDPAVFRSLQDLRGGILAEEMGLGKTLEIIALMLLHPRPEAPVMVFDSFLGRELLTTPATLIVVPSVLLDQWLSELNRHAPSLRVMFYPGVRKLPKLKDGTDISAEQLAQQDVVVTTYEVLRTEIWAAADAPGRSLRNEQQYERIKSPLVQLSWWRVCIDEAQMVENWTNNAAKLARRIPRINAWSVTGTPVKDDVQKDLRGLLLFLRFEPYASDTKIWNLLTTLDKSSFRRVFNLLSMRHNKSLVRNEIAIPPQKRYVLSMPFSAVEEQHYQSLFEELAETCGLDAQGHPLQADWDPEDPGVQRAMRVALDRLRQTVLHPEVGIRSRRALGRKAGPMRTVSEVLEAMLDQSEGAMRADQRSLLSAAVARGQILACQKKVTEALAVWQEVLEKSTEMVAECRLQLSREVEEARKGKSSENQPPPDDEEAEDVDEEGSPQLGEARRRLRSALEIQHRAVFYCGNAYFSLKSNEEITVPDSEEFKRLEKLEITSYDRAKEIRAELLQDSNIKVKELMDRLARAAAEQAFAVIPGFKTVQKMGIESRRIADALEELSAALDEQAAELDDWREHVIQLLLKPLVDEEKEDITGEEYEQSTKLQEEILVYLQILRAALADRRAAIAGQRNFLVEHEIKTAMRMAIEGDGPFPEKFLELVAACEAVKPPFVEGDPLSSVRGVVLELRSLSAKLRHEEATGNSRSAHELLVVSNLLKVAVELQTEQTKAVAVMDRELDRFMVTLNARIEYYRQLQAVSDMVGEYEGSLEEDALVIALQSVRRQEDILETKLAAATAKHRYLLHLRDTESQAEEQHMCVICQSTFTIGVLTVCGHQFCKECIGMWFRAHHNCPVCKRQLHRSNLHDITLKPQELKVHSDTHHSGGDGSGTPEALAAKKASTIYSDFSSEKLAEIKNIDLNGPSFTTKVDTLTRHLLWLRQSDPGAKSVVFSQYKEFLDVLGTAFRRYHIGFTSFDHTYGVVHFKEDPGVEVFLLHARAHASGLNLVNANHVFLCEPLLNTALELQAIARVDRIGQQHETTVWLYIVDGTVEESIYDLSVQRRLEHMGRNLKGKGKEPASRSGQLQDANLDEANALEMQQAHLSKLMGKDGISGEAVDKDDLWTCLFGNQQAGRERAGQVPSNDATRRFLAAEVAERRVMEEFEETAG